MPKKLNHQNLRRVAKLAYYYGSDMFQLYADGKFTESQIKVLIDVARNEQMREITSTYYGTGLANSKKGPKAIEKLEKDIR